MGVITKLITRLCLWRDATVRRRQSRRNPHTSDTRFRLEFLEPRLLLSGTPLAVTQFSADASGFTAQFNQAIEAAVLNLYDTEAATLGPADVTIVGAAQGSIKGSLVVNSDQVTFVKTGGVLLPDVYTVTMRSASNGFKGADGTILDGNNDGTSGDDYVHAFTVGPVPSAIVSVGDFARGPAQSVIAGSGLPVFLSNGTNVTDVRFSLVYDAALLTITDVRPGSGLPNGTQLNIDLTQPGIVTVHIISSPMAAGSVELIRLIAEVPAAAPYARSGVLDVNQVIVNNGAISSAGDDGIEVVAYFGDTTGNQRYSALDGSRTLRVVTGLDSGFLPYPTIDPTIIADITANNSLSSLDGTRILQEVVGLDRPEIPDIVPVVLVGLVDDTGVSNSDLITSNPAVSGTLSDDGTITMFRVGLDDMLPGDFVNVTAEMQGSNFVFSREKLEQILGAPLSDGIHTVHFEATDNSGIGPFFGEPATSPVFDPNAPSPVFNPGASKPTLNPAAPSPVFDPSAPGPIFDPNASGPVFDESVSGNTSIVNLTFTLETNLSQNTSFLFSTASDLGIPDANITVAALNLSDISDRQAPANNTLNVITDPESSEGIQMSFSDTIPMSNMLDLISSIGGGILTVRSSDGPDPFADYTGSSDLDNWSAIGLSIEVAEDSQSGDVTPSNLTPSEEFSAPESTELDSTDNNENLSGDAQAELSIEDTAVQMSITNVPALNGSEEGLSTTIILDKDAPNNSASLLTRSFTLDTLLPLITFGSILTGSIAADPVRSSKKMAGRSR